MKIITRRIRFLDGRPVDFKHPPRNGKIVRWGNKKDANGRLIKGDFRSISHLEKLNRLCQRDFGVELIILQPDLNTTVEASAGTHDKMSIYDVKIPGISWFRAQRWLRAHGFFCWYRPTLRVNGKLVWISHIHGGTLPPWIKNVSRGFMKIGVVVGQLIDGGWSLFGSRRTSSQIEDYYEHKNGLSNHAPDDSWHPKNIGKTVFDLDKFCEQEAKRLAA